MMLCPALHRLSFACSAAVHVPRNSRLPHSPLPCAAPSAMSGTAQTATVQVSECAQRQLNEGVIDMAAGQPGPSLLPLSHIAAAAAHRFAGAGADPFILQYGPEQGYASFRASLAAFLTQATAHEVQADDLLITAGVSHGLDLACRHLQSHLQSSPLAGGSIFVQVPTYFLAGAIMRQAGLQLVPVPSGPLGMDVDSLQQLLEQPGEARPSLLYLVPVHGNPTGLTLPLEQRQQLVQLAHKHGFLILADEVYQLLSFPSSPPPPPPMRAVERSMMQGLLGAGGSSSSSRVVSLSSFSKIMAPGLRLGWIEAAPDVLARLRQDGVLGSGGSIAPLASGIAHSCLETGSLQQHLQEAIRPRLQDNASALCDALTQHLPAGCSFNRPLGGYFVWVSLPDEICSEALLRFAADKYNVRFTPGRVCEGRSNELRTSFAFYSAAELQEGARRLGAAITAFQEQLQQQA